jgi:hypothetical protein
MKLEPTSDPLQKRSQAPRNQFQATCCSLKTLKRVGTLLAFHVMNVVVATAGVISVALLIASMTLMPAWLLTCLLVALVMLALHAVGKIPNKSLKYCGYAVLVVLYFASMSIHWIATVAPDAAFWVGAVGVGFFFLSVAMMKVLVKVDVHLASAASLHEAVSLRSDECADQFSLSDGTDASIILPHLRMTRRLWIAVLYFAVVKVFTGSASVVIIVCVLIQPAVALFSGGDAPFLTSQLTFRNYAAIYILLMVATWVAGVVALPTVARVSVKMTSAVCCEWKSEQAQAAVEQQQNEADIEAGIPVTPEPGSSSTSFKELDALTVAAQSA